MHTFQFLIFDVFLLLSFFQIEHSARKPLPNGPGLGIKKIKKLACLPACLSRFHFLGSGLGT